jgi:uracil-DNA glycosylase
VLEGRSDQRAYILGQAPGSVEAAERRPWRGRAGQTLRRWLQFDEDEFYATFYCASVTRCYPGKAPSGRGDRTPTPHEQMLCSFWRDWELRLLRPRLIVPVGGLAVRRLLGLASLTECVGERYVVDGATAIPLPHPSGASAWLNDPANRARVARAAARIREELTQIALEE